MPYNDRLFQLLSELDDTELTAIWVNALKRSPEDEEFADVPRDMKVVLISAEWRAAHGHSVRNLWRGTHDLSWKRILIDVADKLNDGWTWTPYRMDDDVPESEIEQRILQLFDERARAAWAAMSDEDKAKLSNQLNADLQAANKTGQAQAVRAGAVHVSTSGLSAGIGAGLLAGAGITQLAAGASSFALAGVLGGTLTQIGLWVTVRLFGVFSGAQLAAGGGAAAVGGAVLSAPAAVAFLANAVMSTAYRKSIPATLMVLGAHELRRQLSELE